MKNLKPLLPHLLIVFTLLVLSYVYFYPVLEGKVLKANDSSVSDYNSREIRDFREANGKDPLWTNSIFSGMPAYLILVKHPGNLIKYVDNVLRIFKMPVSVLFLSMAGFYLMLLIFGLNPWLALTGALAYGLSSFLFQILAAGHNTQAIALAYMPPLIGGVYYAYRHDAWKGALFTGLILSLELLANHPQITYYAMLCLLIFVVAEFIGSLKEKRVPAFVRTSLILIIPVVLAIGINFSNLYTIYEYSKYSIRSKSDLVTNGSDASSGLDRSYITHWSYGVDETFNLLIPNYKGGSSKPFDRDSETVRVLRQNNASSASSQVLKYWGTQPGTDGPHYVGAVVFFLFVLGLLIVRGREKWWLLTATLLSVMLAWGKNFMPLTDFFIDFFPGYNKFRAVTMTLVIAQFCIPLLGALALRDLFNGAIGKKELLKGFNIAVASTGGFLLIILMLPGIAGSFINEAYETGYPDWLKAALVTDRKDLLRTDAFRSLVFIALSAGTIFAFLKEKIRKEYVFLILGLLVLTDLWSIDKRYLDASRFEKPSEIKKQLSPSAADQFILADESYKRVLNLSASTFNDNSPTSYFHSSIGGYHGAKMRRYQELIDSVLFRNIMLFEQVAQTATSLDDFQPVFRSTNGLNMLNARYVIINPEAPPLVNDHALGNAWFAGNLLLADNANEELLATMTLNPGTEAVTDRIFSDLLPGNTFPLSEGDTIYLTSYQPNELNYRYTASGQKLAVFSEIYYPEGWKSFIDGKEAPHFRVNYLLRAMILPEGDHEIRFSFEPASYYKGNKVSLASSLLLILLFALSGGREIVKKLKKPGDGQS